MHQPPPNPRDTIELASLEEIDEHVVRATREFGWAKRPVVVTGGVGRGIKMVQGVWVVLVPAGEPLSKVLPAEKTVAAAAGTAVPPTPRLDALLQGSTRSWREFIEPAIGLWLVIAGVGVGLMQAASGSGMLIRGVWIAGLVLVIAGVAATGGYLVGAVRRVVRGRVGSAVNDADVARAFIHDLRDDWRRLAPHRWLRASDVPQNLPVLLLEAPRTGEPPPLLLAYTHWIPSKHFRWLRAALNAVRRPSALVITDYNRTLRPFRGSQTELALLLLFLAASPIPAGIRSTPYPWPVFGSFGLMFGLILAGIGCRTSPSPYVQVLALAILTLAVTGLSWTTVVTFVLCVCAFGLMVRLSTRKTFYRPFIRIFVPDSSRYRLRLFGVYALAVLAVGPSVAVTLDTERPYCLWRAPQWTSWYHGGGISTGDIGGEWIGYRTCLGWTQFVGDLASAGIGHLPDAFGPKRADPDDTPGLFDINKIYVENRRVERLTTGSRPIATIAMITSITTSEAKREVRSVVAERENLAGAYAAQRRINTMRSERHPYLRIAVVNVGDLLDRPEDKTAELTTRLKALAGDATLVAAVVGVDSREPVRQMLKDSLAARNIAMISPTMSADDFGKGMSDTFFQMSSTNRDQVHLIFEHARRRHLDVTYIYPSDLKAPALEPREEKNSSKTQGPAFGGTGRNSIDGKAKDLYLETIYCDVRALKPHYLWPAGDDVFCGTKVDATGAMRSNDVQSWNSSAGGNQITCPEKPSSQLIFFGGRYVDVSEFLRDLRSSCPGKDLPEVAAADSSARFLADPEQARHVPHGTRVLISYRGPVLTCANLANQNYRQPGTTADKTIGDRRADFLSDVESSLARCTGKDQPADQWLAGGWAALTYDAVLMIDDTLTRTRPSPDSSSPSSARERVLICLRGRGAGCSEYTYQGAYGDTRFVNGVARRTTNLLRIDDLSIAYTKPGQAATIATCVPPEAKRADEDCSLSLANANLHKENLVNADLAGLDMRGADLSGADLRSADLRSADLTRANLKGTIFTGARFGRTNLSCTHPRQATGLTHQQLHHAVTRSPTRAKCLRSGG